MGLPKERAPQGPDSRSRIFTLTDYWKLPNDGKRYEILEGELFMSPSPIVAHQDVVLNLVGIFLEFLRAHPEGKLLVAPMDVIFSEVNVCEPDLLFIAKERIAEIVRERIYGAPDLAIEVLSPSTASLDHVKKRLIYERFRVREYWIVDPVEKILSRYRLEGDTYGHPEVFERADTLTTPLLAGLEIPIEKVFAGID